MRSPIYPYEPTKLPVNIKNAVVLVQSNHDTRFPFHQCLLILLVPKLPLVCSFPSSRFTTIKLVANRNVGAGFSLRPDTHRSLKAAPTGHNLMVVKLPLGNGVFEAPASRRTAKQELERKGFPSRNSRRYTQVRLSRNIP